MVTIADVAELAEVSIATVSNVIKGQGRVGERTRFRVLAAIRELNYRPNLRARSFSEGSSRTIALVVKSISDPFEAAFALAVERAALRRNHFVVVGNVGDDGQQAHTYFDPVDGPRVDGVLALNSDHRHLRQVQLMHEHGVPIVLCMWDQPDRSPGVPCVAVDFEQAGRIAADHLLQLGHRRIGALVGSAEPGIHAACYEGFRDQLSRSGIKHSKREMRLECHAVAEGRNAASELLETVPDLSAIFATSDVAAISGAQAAVDLGRSVPMNLSICGIGDIEIGRKVFPGLTTVAVGTEDVAERAVELALRLIGEARSGTAVEVPAVLGAAPHLLVRKSTTRVLPARWPTRG